MLKVCLINPPYDDKLVQGIEYYTYSQPIQNPGIASISACLTKFGIENKVIEAPINSLSVDGVSKIVLREKFDIIGISTYFFNFINVARLCQKIKNLMPNSIIFLGGYFPTLRTKEVFSSIPSVDICVIGEGEETVVELIQNIAESNNISNVKGIAFRQNNEIVYTETRPIIDNLDLLPRSEVSSIRNHLFGITTKRGCYGNCSFCSVRYYSNVIKCKRIRRRSIVNIVNEIDDLVNNYGVKFINFNDDNFLIGSQIDKQRISLFCELIKKRNIKFKFRIFARSNDLIAYKEQLKDLIDIGLDVVFLGVESFVQRQLDMYNKLCTVEQNINAVRILNENNVKYSIGLIIFEPFTNLNEISINIKTLIELQYYKYAHTLCNLVSMSYNLMPLMDSPIYHILDDNNLLCNSALGFRFIDKKVENFYNAKTIWTNSLKPITELFFVIEKANYFNKDKLYKELVKLKENLMLLDLQFMLDLCKESENASYQELIEFVNNKICLLHSFKEKFENAREQLKNFNKKEVIYNKDDSLYKYF